MPVDLQQFEKLDAYALKVSPAFASATLPAPLQGWSPAISRAALQSCCSQQVNVRSSVEELVRALLKQARTDLEKVRAIWMWICHHIGGLRSSAERRRLLMTPSLGCLWCDSFRGVGGRLSGCLLRNGL